MRLNVAEENSDSQAWEYICILAICIECLQRTTECIFFLLLLVFKWRVCFVTHLQNGFNYPFCLPICLGLLSLPLLYWSPAFLLAYFANHIVSSFLPWPLPFVPELCFADLTTVSVFIYKTHAVGLYGIGSFLCSVLWHDLVGTVLCSSSSAPSFKAGAVQGLPAWGRFFFLLVAGI